MDFGLSEEQEMIVQTVRSFVENEIYPHEDLVERTGEVPAEIAMQIKKKTMIWVFMPAILIKRLVVLV